MRKGSYYEPETKIIGFYFHGWIGEERAFCKAVNDVDHEMTHWILHEFIGIEATVGYDSVFKSTLNSHLHIGYTRRERVIAVNKRLARKPSLVKKREIPFPHYEVHFENVVEFRRMDGTLIKRSKVEPYP